MATLYRPIYLNPIGSDTDLKDGQADVSYTPILSSTTNRESEGILARNRTLKGEAKSKTTFIQLPDKQGREATHRGKRATLRGGRATASLTTQLVGNRAGPYSCL